MLAYIYAIYNSEEVFMMVKAFAGCALGSAALLCFPAAAQEVTWQAIFSIPAANGLMAPSKAFIDDVNASCKGLISIQLRGGPEVIPVNDQLNAVRRAVGC